MLSGKHPVWRQVYLPPYHPSRSLPILCSCKCSDCKNYDDSLERRAILEGRRTPPAARRRRISKSEPSFEPSDSKAEQMLQSPSPEPQQMHTKPEYGSDEAPMVAEQPASFSFVHEYQPPQQRVTGEEPMHPPLRPTAERAPSPFCDSLPASVRAPSPPVHMYVTPPIIASNECLYR